jgi:hypothetical protein
VGYFSGARRRDGGTGQCRGHRHRYGQPRPGGAGQRLLPLAGEERRAGRPPPPSPNASSLSTRTGGATWAAFSAPRPPGTPGLWTKSPPGLMMSASWPRSPSATPRPPDGRRNDTVTPNGVAVHHPCHTGRDGPVRTPGPGDRRGIPPGAAASSLKAFETGSRCQPDGWAWTSRTPVRSPTSVTAP